jgi:hypothetical protein
MYENTRASRSCFHTLFSLVFGYPGETLALVVHILHNNNNNNNTLFIHLGFKNTMDLHQYF